MPLQWFGTTFQNWPQFLARLKQEGINPNTWIAQHPAGAAQISAPGAPPYTPPAAPQQLTVNPTPPPPQPDYQQLFAMLQPPSAEAVSGLVDPQVQQAKDFAEAERAKAAARAQEFFARQQAGITGFTQATGSLFQKGLQDGFQYAQGNLGGAHGWDVIAAAQGSLGMANSQYAAQQRQQEIEDDYAARLTQIAEQIPGLRNEAMAELGNLASQRLRDTLSVYGAGMDWFNTVGPYTGSASQPGAGPAAPGPAAPAPSYAAPNAQAIAKPSWVPEAHWRRLSRAQRLTLIRSGGLR